MREAELEAIGVYVKNHIDDMNKRFTQLQWTIGLGFTVIAALMGIFNFY